MMTGNLYLQKMVLKVAIEDEKSKRKALKTVAGVEGKFHSINQCSGFARDKKILLPL